MTSLVRIWIVAIGLCTLPATAGADTFMLIQGVAGDSTAKGHEGWIRVSELDWGAVMPVTSSTSGGGATVGRASGRIVKLTIPTGSWSRELLNNLVRGNNMPQVIIDHVNPDGRPAYRVALGNLVLTSYGNTPAAREPAQDEIQGAVGNFKIEFYTVGADGRVTSSAVGWNFVSNTPVP